MVQHLILSWLGQRSHCSRLMALFRHEMVWSQNCDVAKYGHNVIAFADGCGLGQASFNAAKVAVQIAYSAFIALLQKEPPQTVHKAFEYTLSAIDKAQESLAQSAPECANTTLRLTALFSEFCISASVGDTLLLLTRADKDGKLVCLNPSEQKVPLVDSKNDPGGFLGPAAVVIQDSTHKLEGADLRNLSLSIIRVRPGDMIHILSDGTYSCFDPAYAHDPSKAPTEHLKKMQSIQTAFASALNSCRSLEDVAITLDQDRRRCYARAQAGHDHGPPSLSSGQGRSRQQRPHPAHLIVSEMLAGTCWLIGSPPG